MALIPIQFNLRSMYVWNTFSTFSNSSEESIQWKQKKNQWNWYHLQCTSYIGIYDCNDWVICKTAYSIMKSKINIMDLRWINRNITFNSPNLSVAEFAPSFSKQWLLLRVLQKICQARYFKKSGKSNFKPSANGLVMPARK